MSADGNGWRLGHCYGSATWTDMARIRECRYLIVETQKRVNALAERGANPMEIVQERITLQGAKWELRQLESKFELRPCYF